MAEREESVKKLTLEHELELDALKEQWHDEEQLKTDELTALREVRARFLIRVDFHLA